MNARTFLTLSALVVASSPVTAQAPERARREPPPERAEMERRLRARLGAVVVQRLGLTQEQTQRLRDVDQRLEPERRTLLAREVETRRALQRQVARGDSADQQAVAALLEQALVVQRERVELMAREQRELAAFLTPVQRAKLIGLQADLHRRVMLMHRGPGRRRAR